MLSTKLERKKTNRSRAFYQTKKETLGGRLWRDENEQQQQQPIYLFIYPLSFKVYDPSRWAFSGIFAFLKSEKEDDVEERNRKTRLHW